MAAAIPNFEPDTITAGDTAKWTRSLVDYPPGDGWTLSYAMVLLTGGLAITFSGTQSGSDHLINVAPDVTQAWAPGEYKLRGYVSKAGDRFPIASLKIQVLPNFSSGTDIADTRSRARRILDFIEGSFEKIAGKQTVAATVEGVQFTFRSMDELVKARNYWATIVRGEENKASGKQRSAIYARFTNPAYTVPGIGGFPWR